MADKTERKIELLAPAGSYETFLAVMNAGADAVYLGGNQFGARAYANNFGEEELLRAIDYVHLHGKQLYLTVNTLFKEDELEQQLYDYLLPYYKQGLDAVIVQDIGAFSMIRDAFPGMDIHTSTQMTITNRYGAELMKKLGANRVVTAREMSFAEIRDIHEHVEIEIESFVHGALCYCYSGQCLLSSMLGGRSGNRGRCAQPCRLPYEVYDSSKNRIHSQRTEKLKENYILSPKDLCTIEAIPQLVECGIHSFKIEGRMKQAEYAAGVVSVYRKYLDLYLEAFAGTNDEKEAADAYHVQKSDLQKLYDFGNRSGFTDGYYHRHNGKEMITFEKPNHAKGNEALQQEVRAAFLQTEIKEKIKGNLKLFKDLPATMSVSYKNTRAEVSGEIVQPAIRQPLLREKIEGNMKKTGNTPFEFEAFTIEMDPDIFLPVQSLNQLRRETLDKLNEELIKSFRREEHGRVELSADVDGNMAASSQNLVMQDLQVPSTGNFDKKNISVSIEDRNLITEVLSYDFVNEIYLDSSCYQRQNFSTAFAEDCERITKAGRHAYYIMPAIFRKNTAEFYEKQIAVLKTAGLTGVIVKNFDTLAFLQVKLPEFKQIIFDHNMYTFNNRAKKLLSSFEPLRDTVPLELNRKELFRRDNRDSEILIYGKLALMTTAGCVYANMGSCDKQPTTVYLKDRYGKYFPVKNNCMECYNTIYNTTPLILFAFGEDFKRMGLSHFRISFTTEDEKKVREIMTLCQKVWLEQKATLQEAYNGAYTNGHYKRGVE